MTPSLMNRIGNQLPTLDLGIVVDTGGIDPADTLLGNDRCLEINKPAAARCW
jgi:hypothetical protein